MIINQQGCMKEVGAFDGGAYCYYQRICVFGTCSLEEHGHLKDGLAIDISDSAFF